MPLALPFLAVLAASAAPLAPAVPLAPAAPALAAPAPLPSELPSDLPAPLTELLRHGRFTGTPASFRIIALSSVADACAARAAAEPGPARACLTRTLELARKTRPASLRLDAPDARHGLWLSHLALVLGAGDPGGACLDAALHRRVAEALAQRSLAEPLAHVPSYPDVRARWPADQSATLAALARYDRAHGTQLLGAPLRRYAAVLAEHTARAARADSLPPSELTGAIATGPLPRGCALSFTVRYLAEADAPAARALWQRYRAAFLVDGPLVSGFREWPPGVERPADADSGPIVLGIGTAASALGIAAARAMGDEALAARLEATADRVTAAGGALSAQLARAAGSTLAAALRASARAVSPSPSSPAPPPTPPPPRTP